MVAEAIGQMLYILVWLLYNPVMRGAGNVALTILKTLVFLAVILIAMAAVSIGVLSFLGLAI